MDDFDFGFSGAGNDSIDYLSGPSAEAAAGTDMVSGSPFGDSNVAEQIGFGSGALSGGDGMFGSLDGSFMPALSSFMDGVKDIASKGVDQLEQLAGNKTARLAAGTILPAVGQAMMAKEAIKQRNRQLDRQERNAAWATPQREQFRQVSRPTGLLAAGQQAAQQQAVAAAVAQATQQEKIKGVR